jgi:hypothetical protein
MKKQDSIRRSKDLSLLFSKGFIKSRKDTLGLDDDQPEKEDEGKNKSGNENTPKKSTIKSKAILPKNKKLSLLKNNLSNPRN